MTFKPRDRVKIRGYCSVGQSADGRVAKVEAVMHGGDVAVNIGNRIAYVKPSQCIRLKKRERRRWTLYGNRAMGAGVGSIQSGPAIPFGEAVEVVEVKRRKGK